MKTALQSLLSQSLCKISPEGNFSDVHIEVPEDTSHGDYATNIAMQLVKTLKKNPRQIAQEIIDGIPENDIIESVSIAGPGFINFFIHDSAYLNDFSTFSPKQKKTLSSPQKTVLEFCSPNVAKPLHIGHLRGAVIGESLARIHEAMGETVVRENFLGDWGTGFGKLIMAIEKWGDMSEIEKNPIQELVRLYTKFTTLAKEDPSLDDEAREAFRKIEVDKDENMTAQWKWIRKVSIEQLEKFYEFMEIDFDLWNGESFYAQRTDELLSRIEKIGERSEGALICNFYAGEDIGEDEERKKQMPTVVFQRADGATLYQTRDVAHMEYLKEEGVDNYIVVVGSEQNLHFRQVFETARKLGVENMNMTHVNHGLILGTDGKKFSTRGGNGVGLESLFEEAEMKMKALLADRSLDFPEEEKAELIHSLAVGAIRFNDLAQNRITDAVFDWDKMLSFEGFSGPFLQYSHARAKSILRKAETNAWESYSIDCSVQRTDEMPLVQKILAFSDALELSAQTNKPNVIAEYLFELAKEFNRFYQKTSILNAESEDDVLFRLHLTSVFALTLKQGLYLLGMKAPERM